MTTLLPRHLPTTATPLRWDVWRRGLDADASALTDFAAALAAYVGVPHAFLAASGRTTLRLLLDTLPTLPHLRTRREVVLPGYTCPSLGKVVLDAGLLPRFIDIDPITFNYTPAGLAAAVQPQTLAVMVVHPFGLPVDVAPALAAANTVGALVIEDAAQSLGARQARSKVGTTGHVGLFSLGPGKPLALGGGGFITTQDAQLAAALAATWATLPAPQAMQNRWAWMRLALFHLAFQPSLWWWATRAGAQRAGESEKGWGYARRALTPAQAAVGLALLPHLETINQQRRAHAEQLLAALTDLPNLTRLQAGGPSPDPIYLRLPLLAATAEQAEALYLRLWQAGLGAGRMYRHTMPEFFPQLATPALPGATRVAQTLLTLPTHYHLRPGDVARITTLLQTTAPAALAATA